MLSVSRPPHTRGAVYGLSLRLWCLLVSTHRQTGKQTDRQTEADETQNRRYDWPEGKILSVCLWKLAVSLADLVRQEWGSSRAGPQVLWAYCRQACVYILQRHSMCTIRLDSSVIARKTITTRSVYCHQFVLIFCKGSRYVPFISIFSPMTYHCHSTKE